MMKILIYMLMLNFIINFINYYYFIIMSLLMFMLMLMFFMILNYNNYFMLIYLNFGFDNLSICLSLLTLMILSLCFLLKKNFLNKKNYLLMLILLMLILMLSFMSMNFFMFYLFFEFSLIPIFMIIMGWGLQSERLKASMYMIFYTLFFSLPFLILMFFIYMNFNSLSLLLFNKLLMNKFWKLIFYFLSLMIFLVKLPMFIFHNWLPKAHVEAPVTGSVILAAIMLKLGGYGIIRLIYLFDNNYLKMNDLLMTLSLFSMLILSMICLRQFDLKVIVAYSSVVHMGMMLIGLLSMKIWGLIGCLMMLIGHGISSSSMFIMVNNFYERSKSRNLLLNKGMMNFIPSYMMLWFLLCMNNMASPPSLNLLSEIMIVSVILNWSMKILLLIIFGMFMSACYNLYIFSYTFHGIYNYKLMKIFNINYLEFMILMIHFIVLNFLFLKLNLLI